MRHFLLAYVGAAVLSGCMVGPDYQRPATALPDIYPGSEPRDRSGASVPADWWKLFNDPALDELVASALANNLDVAAAVARVEEANANGRAVNAAFLPELDVNGGVQRSRALVDTKNGAALAVGNGFQLTLNTAFELDFWGRLRRGAEAARAELLGTRYAKAVVDVTLASVTTQAYFALRSLDAQVAATRSTLSSRADALQVVQRRADAGLSSDLDVNQAAGARSDAAAQLKDLIRQRALAEHQLGVLTGRLDLALAAGDLSRLPQPALPPADLPSSLIQRRPDIRQAEQQLVSQNAQIGVARAAMFPTISLTGSFGGQSSTLSHLVHPGAEIWGLGVGLAGPIFDAGRRAALTDAQAARARQSLAAYQKTIQTSFREVSDALVNIEQYAASEGDLQASVTASREALRLANRRYEAGYSAFLDVLDAQRTANSAELALARNRQALLSSDVDLMRALGGGWDADGSAVAPGAVLGTAAPASAH